MRKFCLFFLITLTTFCSSKRLPEATWHAAIRLNDTLELPFTITTSKDSVIFHNGEERIISEEISFTGDSVVFRMPVFDAEFRCKLYGDKMKGYFHNHARKTKNILPFHAERGSEYRFSKNPSKPAEDISGRYHVIFESEDEEGRDAVGVFKQNGNHLTGTFLTTTGDYRYLEGEVNGNKMSLSCFDGSNLYLFIATIDGDSLVEGHYFSGAHWHDTWHATKDENANLLPQESFTLMKPGYEKFDFAFPDENGKMVSLTEKRFDDKAVIVQIMGSWCPNCMDETKFLSSWYNNERNENIEVIALDYERFSDTAIVHKNIRRLKKQFNINYPVLFAGSSVKSEASKTLPMLNRVFAFPTLIFLDKNKKVMKIHTGFNGPATGEEYRKFIDYFGTVISQLVN